MDDRKSLVTTALALGGTLGVSLVIAGWVMGSQIKATKLSDRYVTVKGLVERTVKSDTGIWNVAFKEAGNDLPPVFAKSQADKQAIMDFFAKQGFTGTEVSVGQIQVTDTQANEYGGNQARNRYIVQQTVTLTTHDVDKLQHAGQNTADLVQAGIVVGGNQFGGGSGISYKWTGLNALKPDMITEATRNARASADRFAADSGSHVGAIRTANQGVFSISAAGPAASTTGGEEGGGGQSADSTVMKQVRVVTTVDYYLQ
ncbi:hypothetical protein Terro_0626 [Terriglobus roseus DSM 18391]|uniref:SIMPL domain-containing protein n=1 Tax=Terriglobus roseus (strain DSM 18391 / NRRL B-41598 / KBS 63) TaxID=926566 RepID=I3ZCJ7_TERRK|nr:SIMPL domain-containing protein [Terriglobus roseus]AFL86965.1 hypothetical protein Terro_0626 [Terriglobus roseus DSM 18391]